MAAVTFKNVDIMFGESPNKALELLDQGFNRQEIQEKTGNVLGAADASLEIEEGEICVLMGLSGSGKSTLLRAVNGLNKVSRGDILVENEGQQINVATCDAQTLRQLRPPLALTRVGMIAEQVLRRFWPLFSIIMLLAATLMLGLHDLMQIELVWSLAVIAVLGMLASSQSASIGMAGSRKFMICRSPAASR